VKFLLDMNVPRAWADAFRALGHEAILWREVGDKRAPDGQIMAFAARQGWVVVTHDLDFGDILAATAAPAPSVVLVRSAKLDIKSAFELVVSAIRGNAQALDAGALLLVDLRGARLRLLPLLPQQPPP
jgi:predicted nuclease of predicted toxin-antitoxin system